MTKLQRIPKLRETVKSDATAGSTAPRSNNHQTVTQQVRYRHTGCLRPATAGSSRWQYRTFCLLIDETVMRRLPAVSPSLARLVSAAIQLLILHGATTGGLPWIKIQLS